MLKVDKVLNMEPLLNTTDLIGGGIYKEYRTDDSRLVIEILKKANQYNSKSLNYARVNDFTYNNEKIAGLKAYDEILDEDFEVKARCVINATGPWVDDLRLKDNEVGDKKLQLTKGVHIVVPFERLPINQSIYFDVADGRMIFAIPRDKITYIGTTDTFYSEDKDNPEVTTEDVAYLLQAVNHMFPDVQLIADDIESDWAGLRPLIGEADKKPSELSRKDEIFTSASNLISIAGGKLTGYRKMAQRAVDEATDLLKEKFDLTFDDCITKQIKLAGGDFKHPKDVHLLNADLQKVFQHKIPNWRIHQLVFRYGSNASTILKMVLSDFFIRRTGMLYFERPLLNTNLNQIKSKIETLLPDLTRHIKKDFKTFEAAN